MARFSRIPLFLLLLIGFSSCGNKQKKVNTFKGIGDIEQATIGVLLGSTQDNYVKEHFPDATVIRLDQSPDVYLALENRKCDAIFVDATTHAVTQKHNNKVKVLVEDIFSENLGVGFSHHDPQLRTSFNRFLSEIRSNGLYDEIYRRWIDSLDTAKMPDLSSIKRTGKPIKVGCSGSIVPFDFVSNGINSGFDIEIMERFAASLHRPIEYSIINFGGLISALSSGMVDVITASITITPERAKQVAFSDSHFQSSTIMVIRKENAPEGYSSMSDITNQTIGVLLGSSQDYYAKETYPGAKILEISDNPQLILSVKAGQCDVGILAEVEAKAAVNNDPSLTILENGLHSTEIGVAFNRDDSVLPQKFNDFLAVIKKSGEYDSICRRWTSNNYPSAYIIGPARNKTGKVLRVGTTGTTVPFSFIDKDTIKGLDAEIISRFADYLGRDVKFFIMNFDALIPSIASGKIDAAINNIMITPERAKEVTFSDPYYLNQSSAIVLKSRFSPRIISSAGVLNVPQSDGSDLSTAPVGVMTGSLGELYLKENYPEANVKCFDDITDAIQALRTNKLSYVMTAYSTAVNACRTDKDIVILPKHFTNEGAAVAVDKNASPELLKGINSSIQKMKENGILDDMISRWIREDGTYQEIQIPERTEGKILRVATSANREPMSFVKEGKLSGLDNELIRRIAYDMGMRVEISDMKFSALTAALKSKKADVIVSNFTITEERSKIVNFSDTYFHNPQILMVMSNQAPSVTKVGFFQKIKNSFVNNLITEKRYQLIIDGLIRTIIISVFAILLGTLLGAGICFLRMSKVGFLKWFAKLYIDLMRGTPVLVLLMIVFYVIFARSNISATSVAILTFAINFAAYVSEMFRTSIEGIDPGQKEAGIALGFSPAKTFRFIIMPQAVSRVLPVFKGEAISLVKMTSVVGYIAVQDLTKASDIIRSRTFDAFFPLIVITIIYFILAWLLGKLLDLLNTRKTIKK